ncbi:MAG: diaminopimelate dehydrogenase [Ruminococcus sp.]|nr:diaminopimelate dehydrogenase [Ruminococcus sp.]
MIKVGILGYGNLGRGVEAAVKKNDDMELVAVYTRRDPSTLTIKTPTAAVKSTAVLDTGKEELDILVICGGSATDLPEMTPKYAAMYNVIDSFDTHARVPEHFANVDKAAKSAGKVGIISCGWDPGMFSLNRVYAGAVLPDGQAYTFWGKGVSQGHSDAVRRIDGVLDARQYTIPVPEALERVRSGENPELTTREKHLRECFVVAEEGADLARIENEIKTMPNYFADYDTTVHFIDAEEMKANHSGLPHGGSVIYSGTTSDGTKHVIEYSLNLDSNPEFTGSVLVAFARAAVRLNAEGASGAKTVFDIAPAYLCRESGEELRAHLL